MSIFEDVEDKVSNALGMGDEDLAAEQAPEELEPSPRGSMTQFSTDGPLPAVENQMKKPDAPTASERGFDYRPEREHVPRHNREEEHKFEEERGAWKHAQWSAHEYDPTHRGEYSATESTATKERLFQAIQTAAPTLPPAFVSMLVGHAWVEQKGTGIVNNNFAGIEGGWVSTTKVLTSTHVSTAEYQANPSKYFDMDHRNHDPYYGKYQGKPCGTIKIQLDRDPPPSVLVVAVHKSRPSFASLEDCAARFVRLIESRVRALQDSDDPAHNDLAARALDGDAQAYGEIVGNNFKITDKKGQKRDFYGYNPDKGDGTPGSSYGDRVANSIDETNKEFGYKREN